MRDNVASQGTNSQQTAQHEEVQKGCMRGSPATLCIVLVNSPQHSDAMTLSLNAETETRSYYCYDELT